MRPDTTTLAGILAGEVRAIDTVTAPYARPRRTRRIVAVLVLAVLAITGVTAAGCATTHHQAAATVTEDPTGAACGDAVPGMLTAAAVSDLARYGTAQTRCLVLPAVLANAGPAALSALCSSGTGAVDATTDAPTVTCRTR